MKGDQWWGIFNVYVGDIASCKEPLTVRAFNNRPATTLKRAEMHRVPP